MGSFVSNFHLVMRKGGVIIDPPTETFPNGQVSSFLYNPLFDDIYVHIIEFLTDLTSTMFAVLPGIPILFMLSLYQYPFLPLLSPFYPSNLMILSKPQKRKKSIVS